MTENELKEKMDKDLDEALDVKNIIDFHFALLEKAYIKGLNTGLMVSRVKWHKVADGDLPKNGVLVLSEKGTLVVYQGDCFRWVEYSPNSDNIKLRKWEEPIAWCEIPKYTED